MKKLLFMFIYVFTIVNIFGQDISYNEEFLVNSVIQSDQNQPVVCGLNDGSFVISWMSYGQDGDGSGIFAQIFDSTANKIGTEIQVNTTTVTNQIKPKICEIGNNQFVICWYSEENDSTTIYTQIFDSFGSKVGPEQFIYREKYVLESSLCKLNDNKFVITWVIFTDTDSTQIHAAICDLENNSFTHKIIVSRYMGFIEGPANVTRISMDSFVVCWLGQNSMVDEYGIYAQIFNGEGEKIGNEISVGYFDDFNFYPLYPNIVTTEKGGFLISWVGWGRDSESGVFAEIFDSNGKSDGNIIKINDKHEITGDYSYVSSLSEGGFIFTWHGDDGSNDGVFGQIIDIDGDKIGKEFQVNSYTNDNQFYMSSSVLSNGSFLITWESHFQLDNTTDIFAKYYTTDRKIYPFVLVSPIYDATVYELKPKFEWQSANQVDSLLSWEIIYNLYIDEKPEFTQGIVYKNISDSMFSNATLEAGKTYYWKVLAKNISGDSLWSSGVNGFYVDENATDVEISNNTIPENFELFQNYPNPFNPTTNITYSLPVGQVDYHVVIKIYDVLGRLVRVLVDTNQQPGYYTVEFTSKELTSGIYFYTVYAGEFTETKKMLLMK